jgi:uncharacterized membrane protein YdjX (TVP38/TMEM64 family)
MSSAKRFLPLVVIALALAMFVALGGGDALSLDALTARHAELQALVAENSATAAIAFVAVYAGLVAISFPGAWALTVMSGLLFGMLVGGSLSVIGATIGATAIYFAAKTAFAATLTAKAGPRLARLREGFEANATSYLLTLRLVPVFPFFLINIAAGVFGMRALPYVLATGFGIVPGTFVYASVGAGAGAIVESGGDIEVGGLLLQPKVLLPIAGLVLLALLPVVVKRLRRRPLATPEA